MKKYCQECNKEFKTISSKVKIGKGKFCSRKCFYNNRKNGVNKECLLCGKSYYIKQSRINKSNFCSSRCNAKYNHQGKQPKNSVNWKKENHPNWKGGINYKNEKIRHSLKYIIWRNEVYKRDNWTCRICKKKCKERDIVAHHLQLFSEFPELRFDIDNGITLCRSCHFREHSKNKKYE